MRLTFLGVRGSTCAPGPDFVRFGGHTSCVAVAAGPADVPTILLDAGTGIRSASTLMAGGSFRGTILVSHLHWDHVQGLPFFAAGDRPGSRVEVKVPAQDSRSGRDLLAQQMSPPAFPITPDGLLGDWTFDALEPGSFPAGGFDVRAFEIAHKGGRTFGYTVASGGRSVAYLPDHAPAAGVSPDALDALAGVDVLIHDAQFVEAERQRADDYGHATVADAVGLAERVGAGTVVLFHHGPHRTDEALERITTGLSTAVTVRTAAEGMVLDVS